LALTDSKDTKQYIQKMVGQNGGGIFNFHGQDFSSS
jgi:hypothetical protein